MRISDWSSDVCSSDLGLELVGEALDGGLEGRDVLDVTGAHDAVEHVAVASTEPFEELGLEAGHVFDGDRVEVAVGGGVQRHDLLLDRHRAVERLLEQLDEPVAAVEGGLGDLVELGADGGERLRSEEHTSELQSLMRISYAVF